LLEDCWRIRPQAKTRSSPARRLASAERIMRMWAHMWADVAPSSLEGPSAGPRRRRRAARIWRDVLGESSRLIEKCSRIRPQAKKRACAARRDGREERGEAVTPQK